VHAHDPDQHGPIDSGHRSNTILSGLRGKASGRGGIVGLPGIVQSRPAKLPVVGTCRSVGAGAVPREGIEVRIGTAVLSGSLRGLAARFVVNTLAVAGGR
jgi:hypothetical protein